MHVLITGANGFIGQALTRRLRSDPAIAQSSTSRLTLLDLEVAPARPDPATHILRVDLGDLQAVHEALNQVGDAAPVDVVFHLASIPGGAAERNHALARRVNLEATTALLELGRRQVEAGGHPPVFVFASSIAVLGSLDGMDCVREETLPRPTLSYGAHKLIGEVLVDDYSRRGWVDGRSMRLPGVLARPPARTGQLSAFLSDMIRELCAGQHFVCPMSAHARTWASSLPVVVDQLRHAAVVAIPPRPNGRTLTPPSTWFSMAELVSAIATLCGDAVATRVRYAPEPSLEALFGRFPRLDSAAAEALGFRADADLVALVRHSLV